MRTRIMNSKKEGNLKKKENYQKYRMVQEIFTSCLLMAKNFVNVTRFFEAIVVKRCQKKKGKKKKKRRRRKENENSAIIVDNLRSVLSLSLRKLRVIEEAFQEQ